MSQQITTAQSLLAQRSWRWRHSLWLLAPLLGFGAMSFVGFVYLAIRTRCRRFVIRAVVACLLSELC